MQRRYMQMYSDTIFNSLNEQQKTAVESTEGYVRVVAGAGSGKTRVLTYRYVYLAKELGVDPNHILSVTFTNKAASEMKSRIHNLMPEEAGRWICTFHGACNMILKQDIHYLSYPSNFVIIDEEDQKRILDKIFQENGITLREHNYKECLEAILFYKTANNPNYVAHLIEPTLTANFPNLYVHENDKCSTNFIIKQYLIEERKNWYLDFEDIISFTLYLLENNANVLLKWQDFFEYIQVDEFQDVNTSQYKLVDMLSAKHKNLFIVGDPDQTIYSWRGANIEFFINFDKAFKNVSTIVLNKNYRSTPEILKVGNALIRYNKNRIEKDLFPIKQSAAKVVYFHAKSQEEECEWIAEKIESLQQHGIDYSKIAILYRSSFMTRKIEEALLNKNIPYKIYAGIEFFRRKEIKDVLSYLRMLVFEDDVSFLRTVNTPIRGIGKKRIDFLLEYSKKNKTNLYKSLKQCVAASIFYDTNAKQYLELIEESKNMIGKLNILDLLNHILKESGYEKLLMTDGDQERFDNINELKDSIKHFIDSAGEVVSLEDYLNNVSLISNADMPDKKASVKMMTIHTAKGLEFPYVFVCCLNEGLFPSRQIKKLTEMEEERRLAYVAFTRAEKGLFLSNAEGFNPHISSTLIPSRFIFNLDYKKNTELLGEVKDEYDEVALNYIQKNEAALAQGVSYQRDNLYKIGDIVIHKTFGKGTVQEISDSILKIKFSESVIRSISATTKALALYKDEINSKERLQNLFTTNVPKASKFSINDRVSHPKFGIGTVTSIHNGIIDISFDDGIKKSLTEIIAPLQKI